MVCFEYFTLLESVDCYFVAVIVVGVVISYSEWKNINCIKELVVNFLVTTDYGKWSK